MDPISLALGIASFAAPRLAKWLGGDKAETVANEVIGLAQSVTGTDNGTAALTALKADPQAMIEFQRLVGDLEVRLYEEETKRLEAVNATMRSEATSNDPYVRRWRPTFGYAMAATWSLQILGTVAGMIYAIVAEPKNAADILTGIAEANAATATMWTVALSVMGVAVWKRSADKKLAAGQDSGGGMFDTLMSRLPGGARG